MDFDLDAEDNELFSDPVQMPSATPSTPNSNLSSSPLISDDLLLSSQSSLHNVLDQSDGAGLGSALSLEGKLHNSKRGPGRPRKDVPILKTPQKRKHSKEGGQGQVCTDRGPTCTLVPVPSSSESSNTGFPEDKLIQNPEELPLVVEKYPGKVCCFCNLGERSVLGQGDFLRWEIDVNKCDELALGYYNEEKQTSLDNFKNTSPGQGCLRRQRSNCKTAKSIYPECLNELDQIGRLDVVALRAFVDGSCVYLHQMCLLWSQGMSVKAPESKSSIESVIARSLSRKCSFCGQYGASVTCKMNCMNLFHLPCAAASGAFLCMENVIIFCKDHVKQAPLICEEANISCRQCSKVEDISIMVMCTVCGDHYHSTCVGLVNIPDTRAGWTCSHCSKCLICREVDGTEGRSIKCEQCQRLYHTSCLRPVISSLPKYGWKCNRCRVCTDCGSRTPGGGTSSRWHSHYTICDSCYQQRNKGFSCPICHKAYRAAAHKEMVKCSLCHRFVHSQCDEDADLNVYYKKKESNPDYDYVCPQCKLTPNIDRLQVQHLGGNPLRCSADAGGDPEYVSATQGFVFKDTETDGIEKAGDDFASLTDPLKISKKKINFKDFHRSRSGKFVVHKSNALSQFGRKRNVRGKNRQLLLASSASLGLGGGDKGNNRSSDDGFLTEKKMLLCSAKDKFILSQDVCVMCGSVGLDKESSLIACAQCGQCYHPYCVNIKLSKVVLQRGWRCLDCTICEGCGQRNDEARLILCDECDLSYHIYCMSPPLDTVPHGNWKCKWCAACQKCGRYCSTSSQSHSGQLECGLCVSQVSCCVCKRQYNENDLIIQCGKCERWLHGECDSVKTEEEAQLCDIADYYCILCRPKGKSLSAFLQKGEGVNEVALRKTSTNSSSVSKNVSYLDTNSTATSGPNEQGEQTEVTFWMDGVCLNEKGANMIKSLSTEIKRKRKMRTSVQAAIESVVSGSNLSSTIEESGDGDTSKKKEEDHFKDGMVWTGTDNCPPPGFSLFTNDEGVSILRRKRQRNLQKLGIGGFNVRNRAPKRTGEECASANANLNSLESEKKKKIIRKKLKSKLSESYPTYLQEAFFGKPLLDTKNKAQTLFESESSDELDDIRQTMFEEGTKKNMHSPSASASKKDGLEETFTNAISGGGDVNENKPRTQVMHIKDAGKQSGHLQPKLEGEIKDEKNLGCEDVRMANVVTLSNEGNTEIERRTSYLTPETLYSSDGHILMEHNNSGNNAALKPEISNKPEESHFNNKPGYGMPIRKVDLPGDQPPSSDDHLLQTASTPKLNQMDVSHMMAPIAPLQMQHLKSSNPSAIIQNKDFSSVPLQQTPPIMDGPIANEKAITPQAQVQQEPFMQHLQHKSNNDPNLNKIYYTPAPAEEAVEAVVAGTQKTAEKMRRDEDLGEMATISAVLYANTQHPELKQIYPNWNDRCKQILKKWRSLSTEKKAPFLQHAKDNRSALRMRKSQQDQERICLNQKTLKEQEQERIWKQHQAKAKEAQINAYGNRGVSFDMNIGADSGSIDKQTTVYSSDILPEAPPNFSADESGNSMYGANFKEIPLENVLLLEQNDMSDKNVNLNNKQLRTLLLKQQDVATSWVPESTSQELRPNIFQQSTNFKGTLLQSNAPKPNTFQCNESKVQMIVSPRNPSIIQALDNAQQQEPYAGSDNQNMKGRKIDLKMPDTGGDCEIEKLESDENVGFGDILGGLGDGNDDDLLQSLTAEIGDDFNILEYADSELDELASSQNLLNKLEFDYNERNS